MIFLDTSGLLSFFDEDLAEHAEAVALFHSATGRLTHSYALAEWVPLCQTRRLPRDKSLRFLSDLVESGSTDIIWVDEVLHRQGMDLLNRRLDKTYSLCDAVSFVLMRAYRIDEALTTDHHFEQEGFRKLLP